MEQEFTFLQERVLMKANGSAGNITELEFSHGQMGINILASGLIANSKVKEN